MRLQASAEEAELIAHAREKLAPYKVPKRVCFVEDLPRNASGKVLKRELRDRHSSAVAPQVDLADQ